MAWNEFKNFIRTITGNLTSGRLVKSDGDNSIASSGISISADDDLSNINTINVDGTGTTVSDSSDIDEYSSIISAMDNTTGFEMGMAFRTSTLQDRPPMGAITMERVTGGAIGKMHIKTASASNADCVKRFTFGPGLDNGINFPSPNNSLNINRDVEVSSSASDNIAAINFSNQTSNYTADNIVGTVGWSKSGDFASGKRAAIEARYAATGSEASNVGMDLYVRTAAEAGGDSADRVKFGSDGGFGLKDGITAPATSSGWAQLYVDSSDGDLKIKFGDGTVKTIVVDT